MLLSNTPPIDFYIYLSVFFQKTQLSCAKTAKLIRFQTHEYQISDQLNDLSLTPTPSATLQPTKQSSNTLPINTDSSIDPLSNSISLTCLLLSPPFEILTYEFPVDEFRELNSCNDDPEQLFASIARQTGVKVKHPKLELPEDDTPYSENDLSSENEDTDSAPTDLNFLIYKNNILADQEHILRYSFHSKTVPLFFSTQNLIDKKSIPNCENCGAARIFEFQINNTLLSFYPQLSELNWGVLCVFSCKNSCFSKKGNGFLEEFVFIQEENYQTVTAPSDKNTGLPKIEEKPEEENETAKNPKKKKNKKPKNKKEDVQIDENDWN